ncbi:MAG: quinolinate synthase NadA [Firmicutes bacterium]|nr:quinolinate synthase NadA [Bacillota bacterium]
MSKKSQEELKEKIQKLKEERKAVILAHNYQRKEIQDIADFVEDSLGLSIQASKTDAKVIVFCGVHFMAETASILSPEKTILLPDPQAGCPMADMIDVKTLAEYRQKYPEAEVLCYVNSTAEIKAMSDVCCTSANALKIAQKMKAREIIFIPDKSLGEYVESQMEGSGKKFHLYPGYCPTHHRLLAEDIIKAKKANPDAVVMVHPECTAEVRALADFILGTGGMSKTAGENGRTKFIVGTEEGMLYRLKKENPEKTFILPSEKLICPNMKLNTLEKVYWALKEMAHVVKVAEEVRSKAYKAIKAMLELS